LAKALVGKQFSGKYEAVDSLSALENPAEGAKKTPFFPEKEIKGKELLDIRYEKIWQEAPEPIDHPENAYRVILGDFVTTEDGTGIVHTAPTFGQRSNSRSSSTSHFGRKQQQSSSGRFTG
jgi:isoleucyl-tRNA synthetase